MKRVSKLLLLVLGFSAGLLAGAFIRLGFEIINGRPVSIGGEALLLPLVILLICFGFSLGKEVRVQRNTLNGEISSLTSDYEEFFTLEEVEISADQ